MTTAEDMHTKNGLDQICIFYDLSRLHTLYVMLKSKTGRSKIQYFAWNITFGFDSFIYRTHSPEIRFIPN